MQNVISGRYKMHTKYRPSTLEEIIGHKEIVESIMNLFKKGVPHAFLFSGPSGTGKTTFARIIANMLSADKDDIIEINVANTNGVDYIRDMNNVARYSPLLGQNKVFIMDECQQLTKEAQNCLLKILEDSPKYSYFILCTTDSSKILPTIKNRCTSYSLNSLSNKEIEEVLNRVIKNEKLCISEDIFNLVVYKTEGCPRKALVLLNQVKDIIDFNSACKLLADELDSEAEIIDIIKGILYKKKSWQELMGMFSTINIENETIRITFANYLSGCLKNAKNNKDMEKFSNLLSLFLSPLTYGSGKAEIVFLIYKAFTV